MIEKGMTRWNNVIKIILFMLILIVGIYWLSPVFILKNTKLGSNLNAQTSAYYLNRLDGFYNQQKDSLDVIFLGGSQVHCDISPMVMYDEYGFTSYDVSADQQPFALRYRYILETLKTQNPQVIVVDVNGLLDSETAQTTSAHYSYDYMKLSPNKIAAVVETTNSEDWFRMLFPFFEFHTRWKEVDVQDFEYLSDKQESVMGGFLGYSIVHAMEKPGNDNVVSKELPEVTLETFHKIEELCAEKDIQLVFIKLPCAGGQEAERLVYNKALQEYAEESGINYIDYTFMAEELGIDYNTDFTDVAHLNINGARKVSKHLGGIVSNMLTPGDKAEEVSDYWNENLETYKEIEGIARLKMLKPNSENDLKQYMEILEGDYNLSAIIVGKADTQLYLDFDQHQSNEVGIWNYFGVIDNGIWINEKTSFESIDEVVKICDKEFQVQIDAVNNVSEVIESRERCMNNGRGLNIIVINRKTGEVVDTKTFDIYHFANLRLIEKMNING